ITQQQPVATPKVMKTIFKLFIFVLIATFKLNAQESTIKTDSLQEVIITSTRIDLPFKENSRTITILSAADIKNSAAVTIVDLLQQVAGVDIRRRGAGGSQA